MSLYWCINLSKLHSDRQSKQSRVEAVMWLIDAEIDLVENAQILRFHEVVSGINLQKHILKETLAVPVLVKLELIAQSR